jgi:hypothetical protein
MASVKNPSFARYFARYGARNEERGNRELRRELLGYDPQPGSRSWPGGGSLRSPR